MKKGKLVLMLLALASISVVVSAVLAKDKVKASEILSNFSQQMLGAGLALVATEREIEDDIK